MRKHYLTFVALIVVNTASGQTGPLNPATAGNNASVGTNAWATPNNIFSSNNNRATVATAGITNYLTGTNFGFAIPGPAAIDGIRLEVERSATGQSNVAILNTWTTGTTKTVSAGTNRYLVVYYSNENGLGTRDLVGLTYGGQEMVQLGEFEAGTAGGFIGRVEAWGLDEAGIALAGSTTLLPTYGAYTPLDYCEGFSSIALQNVDQIQPVNSVVAGGASANTDPHQLPSPLTTIAGGISLNGVGCGNPGTYTINSTYVEGNDFQITAGTGSGATIQTAHKLSAASGTEQPSCNFSGTVNRWFMVGLHIQRATNLDNTVSIIKSGAITGNNYALTATDWPATEAYVAYGGATDLWGTTWALADVNAANFGAAVSTRVQNGTVRVDHMRITVWSHSTLPVELLDFTAEKENEDVRLKWITASEINNDYFVVQRSPDGIAFEDIQIIDGAGNSNSMLYYTMLDENPLPGTSYYRLKQVDFDGTTEYSPIKAVSFNESSVLVYPNPSNGIITIYNSQVKVNQVAVYSSDLKLVSLNNYTQEVNPIVNLENLADGAYIMVIKTENETKVTKILKSSVTR